MHRCRIAVLDRASIARKAEEPIRSGPVRIFDVWWCAAAHATFFLDL